MGLFDELNFVSGIPTSVVHVSVNGEPTLFLGTDKGLIKSETPDAKGVLNLEWVFDQYNNTNLRNLTYEHELNLFVKNILLKYMNRYQASILFDIIILTQNFL